MINQVDFEGYLTRSWEYREQKYIRLANHRPGENGKTSSDYVTVQLDSSLEFNPGKVKMGRLLRVTGRIVGRDIVEPLKLVVGKSHDSVELPGELNNLIIRRPTVQILATQVKLLAEAKTPKPKTKVGQKVEPVTKTELPAVPIQPGIDLAELASTN
jgi:hypothetical protein